jgi:hypothetical protein
MQTTQQPVQGKNKQQYLTQAAKEESDRNLTFYTSDWKSTAANQEAKQEQSRIQQMISRGEREEIVEGSRMGAKKTLTSRENTRIDAENKRRQAEYDRAVKAEQDRYAREMAAYNAAVARQKAQYKAQVDAYNKQVAAQKAAPMSDSIPTSGRKKSGNEFRKAGRAIGKVFGW